HRGVDGAARKQRAHGIVSCVRKFESARGEWTNHGAWLQRRAGFIGGERPGFAGGKLRQAERSNAERPDHDRSGWEKLERSGTASACDQWPGDFARAGWL